VKNPLEDFSKNEQKKNPKEMNIYFTGDGVEEDHDDLLSLYRIVHFPCSVILSNNSHYK